MEIVVGTYDEVLLGLRVIQVGGDYQIETSFTDRSHAGCVKTVAVSNKGVLASGSTDETIRLLNLKKQRELGSLVHHSGTITSLDFHKGFLFSTSEDGRLCLWKTFTWECLRTFKGHKSAVNSVSVHPSGKLALTVGTDRSLHTWNLITGRSAYITNIKQAADIVKWSPNGEKYLIVFNNRIDVYSVETAEVIASIKADGRINSLDFYNDTVCVYGGEGGGIFMHDIETNRNLHKLDTNTVRVKGLCVCPPLQEDTCKKWLCMCSSDGHVKIYKVAQSQDKLNADLVAEYTSSFRLTCLAVYNRDSGPQIEETENQTVTEETNESTDNDKVEKQKNKKKISVKIADNSQIETVKEENSERSDKRNKKKNKKRKINSEENVDIDESEIGSGSRKTKKLKSYIREENSDFSPQKKAKKNKKKKQQITGAVVKPSPKKKNKMKKKMKSPV